MPAVVVTQDTPQGTILWVNAKARKTRILPGLRYAAGLSIDSSLRAGVVSDEVIDEKISYLANGLHAFTPHVEPARDLPGTFWLDASGLRHLHPSLLHWADAIRVELYKLNFHSTVVAGFSRFGTYALAKASKGTVVFDNAAEERAAARDVVLEMLDIEPSIRESLRKLAITTVGGFLDLPAPGILERFGPQAYSLYKLAAGEHWIPFLPETPEEPVEEREILDEPVSTTPALLFLIKEMLGRLLKRLASRAEAVAEFIVLLKLNRTGKLVESIRPAFPTLDEILILDLTRLRLGAIRLPSGVIEIKVTVVSVRASKEQLRLFTENPGRDLEAANRALARVRAELGEGAVMKAELREGHLPEAKFAWRQLDRLTTAKPRKILVKPLIRRIFAKPVALPAQHKHVRDDGWLVRGLEHGLEQGAVVDSTGPYIVSGGWWIAPVHREYHYVETKRGDLLWIYYDRRRRRWFLHGQVE